MSKVFVKFEGLENASLEEKAFALGFLRLFNTLGVYPLKDMIKREAKEVNE